MKKIIICVAGSTLIAGVILLMIEICKKCVDEIELDFDNISICGDQVKE